ncbi:MAG: LytTR family DNA-binding domain-containing protein [Bacteroidetes bacterium]|jgi:two-component system LytT family response regulator|nr:LytTR family DNA-binding domain-containing protein [Bacteroidota bacterium]MCB0603238.1 response regulator transcription factor [Saprospiraceae bacterium]MCO5278491.1 LytTR family DNA-binding domain-containing protein [Saprospiraceae bacterium]HMT76386.1 LytTR family DNA-binding domain-containing protein [Saprospiraceae bacterium]
MIRTIIVDDEEHCIDVLETLIKRHLPILEIVAVYSDPEKALEEIRAHDPDLIFLDINMPMLSGLDLLNQLMPFSFKVIFTTAYDTYAIKALKFGAVDYLLKPVMEDDLKLSVSNLIMNMDRSYNEIERFKKIPKISIYNNEGITIQPINEILFCESDNCYTTFYLTNNKKIITSRSLKEFENLLSKYSFYRIHNSFLVNMDHIQKIQKNDGGYVVINEHKLPISRNKKEHFIKTLNKYIE